MCGITLQETIRFGSLDQQLLLRMASSGQVHNKRGNHA